MWPAIELWFDVLGGQNGHHVSTLRQSPELVEFVKASNLIPDPPGKLVTSPGFDEVRSSAMGSATTAITGMHHLGDLADEFILSGDDGKLYRDNANPPGALAGGTDFTSGEDVLTRGDVFDDLLIVTSLSRDLPQTVNSSATKADLGGTPARGLDVKAFGRRVFMFSPTYSGTTYRHIASFTSSDDDETAWTNPVTVNFLNFGEPGGRFNVLGGERFQDHLMTFTEDSVFPVYQTPNADLPFAFQEATFSEEGGGPPVIPSVVRANNRLYWVSRNFDVKEMLPSGQVRSIGFAAQPFLRGLNDSRRGVTVGGWEPRYRLVIWAVSDGSDTENKDCLMLHVDTGQFYFRTISRNAFANRRVSGEIRLVGGGYTGKFYNEFTGTTGDLDNAASAIDADIQGPRHHLGLPGMIKKGVVMAVELDPIASETVTVQGNYDDETAFSSVDTTISVSGTDVITKFFRLSPFDRFQPRFRDAISGERYRVSRYGFSRPTAIYSKHT